VVSRIEHLIDTVALGCVAASVSEGCDGRDVALIQLRLTMITNVIARSAQEMMNHHASGKKKQRDDED